MMHKCRGVFVQNDPYTTIAMPSHLEIRPVFKERIVFRKPALEEWLVCVACVLLCCVLTLMLVAVERLLVKISTLFHLSIQRIKSCISGAIILGSGDVGLILYVAALIRQVGERSSSASL